MVDVPTQTSTCGGGRHNYWVAAFVAVAALAGWLTLGLTSVKEMSICLLPPAANWSSVEAAISAQFYAASPTAWATEWIAMVFAMMLPLAFPALDKLDGRKSCPAAEAVIWWIVGYLSVWLLAAPIGTAIVIVARGTTSWLSPWLLPAACFGVASLWQLSPIKRRALEGCQHIAGLSTSGFAARIDAADSGIVQGWNCVAACLPVMVLVMVSGVGLLGNFLVFLLLVAERYLGSWDVHLKNAIAVALSVIGLILSMPLF